MILLILLLGIAIGILACAGYHTLVCAQQPPVAQPPPLPKPAPTLEQVAAMEAYKAKEIADLRAACEEYRLHPEKYRNAMLAQLINQCCDKGIPIEFESNVRVLL